MKKLLVLVTTLICFIALICICGCSATEITNADLPQNSESDNKPEDGNEENSSGNELYEVTYVDGETEIEIITVSAGTQASNKPAPIKNGYDFAGWTLGGEAFDFTTPITGNITLTAKYNPIIYTAVFKANNNIVKSVDYTVEDKELNSPAVPQKYGYNGKWEKFDLCGDIVINAIYTPIVYSAKFVVNGIITEIINFTIEDKSLKEPELPSISHYFAEWEDYEISARDITINAIYTPVQYYITFVSENSEIIVPYTVLNKEVVEPEPVQKDGYTVSWESYSLDFTDKTVKAVYSIINYSLTFIANGLIIETTTFNIENINSINVPDVPQRLGFECNWQHFELELSDTIVYAEYTMTFKDEFKYSISKDKTFYTITGYTGKENYLVIPSEHNGIPVKAIGEFAFVACTNFTSVDICNGIEIIEEGAFMACTSLTSVLLPSSLLTIENDAFADSGIYEINIPSKVKNINNNAFSGCTLLTKLCITGSPEIGEYAFGNCKSLKYVDLGNMLVSIGAKAFYNCTSLEEIYIPSSLTEIGSNAFLGCSSLRLVEFENSNGWSVISGSNSLDIYIDDIKDGFNAAKLLAIIYTSYRWICC